MRPAVFLGHTTDDGGPWSDRDRELSRALLMYEWLHCPGCGQPTHESMSSELDGWYVVDEVTCHGCAAKQSHVAGVKEPAAGVSYRVSKDPDYKPRGS